MGHKKRHKKLRLQVHGLILRERSALLNDRAQRHARELFDQLRRVSGLLDDVHPGLLASDCAKALLCKVGGDDYDKRDI